MTEKFGEGERYLRQCPNCRGAGWTKATLMTSMAEISACVDAGLGHMHPPIHKEECKQCSGTGRIYAG